MKNVNVITNKKKNNYFDQLKLKNTQEEFSKKYDKNNNGELDIVETDGLKDLVRNNQKAIIEIDNKYIHNFAKLSIFLKTKSNNLQTTFNLILRCKDVESIEKLSKTFNIQFSSYCLFVFKSYEMVLSLVKTDLLAFYEFYEDFDKLGIFNSNWENEVASNLKDIKVMSAQSVDTLLKISNKISEFEINIVNQFTKMNYSIEEGFSSISESNLSLNESIDEMTNSLELELKGINDKLWWNNLFQALQIFQNRRTNKLLSR